VNFIVEFCIVNIIFNLLNAINSRAKQVVASSWRYNFFSTVAASSAYLITIGMAGRFMLAAKSTNQLAAFTFIVIIYGISSGVGAVCGQLIAIWLEKKGRFVRS
jgi:hypothetical protein